VGHQAQHQKALWLTDDDNVDHGYVVADVTHKLHQQVCQQQKLVCKASLQHQAGQA
jgi:hypothetical protein